VATGGALLMMMSTISIKALYPLALAEGEGVGTAYEYFAKRLALARYLSTRPRGGRLLVAGLPEKYGSSLDFLLLAEELALRPVVVDERPSALEKLTRSLEAAQAHGLLRGIRPELIQVPGLAEVPESAGRFDLAVSSEVLQRLPAGDRSHYACTLLERATAVALFAPNAGNASHTGISGLSGLTPAEMASLFGAETSHITVACDYLDMPPFPPGITRSDSQREQAGSGRLEAAAMWALGYYARLERFVPRSIRRRQAHIVYTLAAELGGDEGIWG
jgi:hypothetical protein